MVIPWASARLSLTLRTFSEGVRTVSQEVAPSIPAFLIILLQWSLTGHCCGDRKAVPPWHFVSEFVTHETLTDWCSEHVVLDGIRDAPFLPRGKQVALASALMTAISSFDPKPRAQTLGVWERCEVTSQVRRGAGGSGSLVCPFHSACSLPP